MNTNTNTNTDPRVVARLMAWLSPAFPTGAFAYSQGLESACAAGLVSTRREAAEWISVLLEHGSIWNDAVLCAEAWRRSRAGGCLDELAELGTAMSSSHERHTETVSQGSAFLKALEHWPDAASTGIRPVGHCPLPVAFGAAAARAGLPVDAVLAAFVHAATSNLIQAVLRLGRLGQADGVALLAELEEPALQTAQRAVQSGLDDLGNAAFMAEIMCMRHETMPSRIFRS